MKRKMKCMVVGLLIITLCVPMNVLAEENSENHSKTYDISTQSEVPEEAYVEDESILQDEVKEDLEEEPENPVVQNPVWEKGWNLYEDNWYYCVEENVVYTGWIQLKSKWYYLDGNNAGIMACDEVKKIGDSYYAFDANGVMQTGWVHRPEGWYYANANGAMAQGWKRVGSAWYYLDGDNVDYPGLMIEKSYKEINGITYLFKASGAMCEGWYYDGTDWYYYETSGKIASGWRAIKGYWYYMDPENGNKMVNFHWKLINNKWYYFYQSGAMVTNWLSLDGRWYYLSGNGAMQTGWQKVNNVWYYLYEKNDAHGGSEGVMAKNTVIDGYVVHENGAYIRSRNKLGWQNPSGYPQVSSLTVKLPSYCTGYFTYVTPSRISINATRQECVDAFIARAYEYIGTRYIEPWSSYPGDAVDCSGFVLQCLYATGMDLGVYNPYNHRWMASQTYNSMNWYRNNTFKPVSVNAIQRGDLIYYRGHVAIYLGNGKIIDSWPGQGVSIKPIGSRGAVIGAARPYV